MSEQEFLTPEEVAALTGHRRRNDQVQWLREHAWRAEVNAAGFPVVGRWYARMKLAGMDFSTLSPGKVPDFAKVR